MTSVLSLEPLIWAGRIKTLEVTPHVHRHTVNPFGPPFVPMGTVRAGAHPLSAAEGEDLFMVPTLRQSRYFTIISKSTRMLALAAFELISCGETSYLAGLISP